MSILVILAHPNPNSFNHALATAAADELRRLGREVILHDLIAEKFDPLLPASEIPETAELDPVLAQHCRELQAAEGLVLVHPNWWGQPPAVLTGWVDRVFRPGVAYRFLAGDSGGGVPRGLLPARAAVVFNTSDTPAEREERVLGDPLERIWKHCVLHFCGIRDVRRKMFRVIVDSTPEQRRLWLEEARRIVREAFPPL